MSENEREKERVSEGGREREKKKVRERKRESLRKEIKRAYFIV